MFGACKFWCMEVKPVKYRGQVLHEMGYAFLVCGGQSGCMYGAWNYMVGSFGLWRSIRVYVWCMEFYGRQFWCMEVNPSSIEVKYGVCLVHEIMW